MDQRKNLVIGSGPCTGSITETQDSFGVPYRNKILSTRANRMKQFLWQEFFNEYNRKSLIKVDLEPDNTQYFEQFCKDKPKEDEERYQKRICKYPLYCTTAITVWNPEGDVSQTFKKNYSITRPLTECTEKFGL